ncbi:MAG: NTP transferase domain-containing protein [Paracoccaceae bacterium]
MLLAAGSARRMQGRDKLLEAIDGEPILTRLARTLMAAGVDQALAVVRPDDGARRAALAGTGLGIVENPRAAEGMGGSLARGVAALPMGVDAALIALADMPDLEADDLARLIAAFDPGEGREIVRAAAQDGTPGHPVLFGRRFFEPLASLGGDEGARRVLAAPRDYVVEVRLPGRRAITDLDTPEAWASWRAARAG